MKTDRLQNLGFRDCIFDTPYHLSSLIQGTKVNTVGILDPKNSENKKLWINESFISGWVKSN